MKINIYALVNPIDSSVFYVGATGDYLYNRLSNHLYSKNKGALADKIRSLGVRPEMLLLEIVHHDQAEFYEQFYMDLFRTFGFALLNKKKI